MKIAYQGKKGAYSQQAALSYFSDLKIQTDGLELSEQVIDAILFQDYDFAVLPIENSIAGNVGINLDLLYHKNVSACGEFLLPIKHHLLAKKRTNITDILNVHSHPIALAQCRDYLAAHKMSAIGHYDTAGACDYVAQSSDKTMAAIGSKLCASYYNLKVISNEVQKVANNITRFLIIKKGEPQLNKNHNKTTLAFTTHHHPGALLECLEVFKEYDINITKLESRPVADHPFQYFFYTDFLQSLNDQKTNNFIEKLRSVCLNVKVLGSYIAAKA